MIFWGSQSGRAEILAKSFASDLQNRFGLKVLAADLDDYDHVHLNELKDNETVVFFLATYGEGDPPDNTNGLWNTLHGMLDEGTRLDQLRYLLFGLGNSKYRYYNRVAETVDAIVQSLGARRIGDFGKGDDGDGETEEDFTDWKEAIMQTLKIQLGLKEQRRPYEAAFRIEDAPDTNIDVVYLGEPHSSLLKKDVQIGRWGDSNAPNIIPISSARKLWESEDRHCVHIELRLGNNRWVKYATGDHLAVYPSNPTTEVNRLLIILNLHDRRSMPVSIQAVNEASGVRIPIFTPTTIEAIFKHYLEISAHLPRSVLQELTEFAPSESAVSKLQHLSADPTTFKKEVLARHLTLADILDLVAPSTLWAIPLSFLLEKLKPLQPRYYSISSSSVVQPRKIAITAVVNTKPELYFPDNKPTGCYGLTTHYLSSLTYSFSPNSLSSIPASLPEYSLSGPRDLLSGSKIFARTRKSAFKLPSKSSTAVILIGAGTGVAPFRAFVQERVRLHEIGREVGPTLLFMGFRHSAVDYLYGDEWPAYQRTLAETEDREKRFEYWTTFSRDQIGEGRKVYVQARLWEQRERVMRILEEDHRSTIYICGAPEMARDVSFCLAKMRVDSARTSEEEGADWVKELRRSARLLEDIWG